MAGLNLRAYGGVSTRATPQTAPGSGGTATAAAFGPGYTAGSPSTFDILKPNDAFGHAFWAGAIAIGLLVFIRHSLPR